MAIKTIVINKGQRGNSVLNGVIPPTALIGVNGDFYIDTVALKIYGPKASSLWGAGTSLGGGGSGTLPNNTYFNARNAANDGDVGLYKLDASNVFTLGDGYAEMRFISPTKFNGIGYYDSSSDRTISMYAPPGAVSSNYSLILPAAQGTGSLTNDGAGNLSWGTGGIDWSTPVDANIVADVDNFRNLGSPAINFANVNTTTLNANNLLTINALYGINVAPGNPTIALLTSGAGSPIKMLFNTTGDAFGVSIRAPSSLTQTTNYVWPTADGTLGQVLSTDGAGQWGWIDAASGGNETLIFAAANNQASPADVTGLILDKDVQHVYYLNVTYDFFTTGPGAIAANVAASAIAIYLPAYDQWEIALLPAVSVTNGDTADGGFNISMTPSGQVQYTTGDVTAGGTQGDTVGAYNLTFLITDPGGVGGGGSGANKALSNLVATSINQDLNPDLNLTRTIGTDALRYASVHAGQFGDYSSPTTIASGGTMTINSLGPLNISASNGDSVVLGAEGAAGVTLYSIDASQAPPLNFNDGTNTKQLSFKAPNALTATSTVFTWPDGDGSAGQALFTDGAGQWYWDDAGGGSGPGGPTFAVQFFDGSAFDGSDNFTFDGTTLKMIGQVGSPASANSYPVQLKFSSSLHAITMGADSAGNYIQGWENKPLFLNGQGNSVAVGAVVSPAEQFEVAGNIKATGSVFASDFRSANDAYYLSKNAANNGYVSLIKADASDQILVGDAFSVIRNLTTRFDVVSSSQVNFYAGNAQVNILSNGAGAPAVRWHDDDSSNFIGLKAPSVVPSNIIYTWPAVDAVGSLTSDGAGNLSWAAGANAALSNLASVQINSPLVFGVGVSGLLRTNDGIGVGSQDLTVKTGPITSGFFNSGNLNLFTGQGDDTSGTVTISSGNSNNVATGDVNVLTSVVSSGVTGNITLLTGDPGGGTRGQIRFVNSTAPAIGDAWTAIATNGAGMWKPAYKKYTFSYSDFSDPSTEKVINVGPALSANDVIETVIVHYTQEFTGGANTQSFISVRTDTGTAGGIIPFTDAFSAASPGKSEVNSLTNPMVTTLPDPDAGTTGHNLSNIYFGTHHLQIQLDTDVANDQLTQGSVDIWVKVTRIA